MATDEKQSAMIRMAEDLHALREHMEATAKANVEASRRQDVSDGGKMLMVLSTVALLGLSYMGILAASTMLMIEEWVVLVVLAVILGGGRAERKKAEKDEAEDAGAVTEWEEQLTLVRAAADRRQSSKKLPARTILAQATTTTVSRERKSTEPPCRFLDVQPTTVSRRFEFIGDPPESE